ncbi:hypothetical protein J6590_086291 [Homalodisca vitripennis]|nr:hypothetical protein J6590_086291 [Homalodisca vitripennis]
MNFCGQQFSDYLIPKSRLVRYKWCQVIPTIPDNPGLTVNPGISHWLNRSFTGAVQKSVIELFPRFCESYGAEEPCGDGTADHQRFQ